MSLYISPNSSFEGGSPMPAAMPLTQNARPQLNESLMDVVKYQPPLFPAGVIPMNSIGRWGTYFGDAKDTSMREMGWDRYVGNLIRNQEGLLVMSDGTQVKVRVLSNYLDDPEYIYRFITVNEDSSPGKLISLNIQTRYSIWNFYTPIEPRHFNPRFHKLPIVPRVGVPSEITQLAPISNITSLPGMEDMISINHVTPGGRRKLRKTRARDRKMRKKYSKRRKYSKA